MKKSTLLMLAVLLTGIINFNCTSKKKGPTNESKPLFTKLEADKTGINFVNKVENQKNFNIFKYRNFYNGGGVAMGDINNDGLTDVFLTANMGKNKLFLNKGDFKFFDITDTAKVGGNNVWSTGVVMVDINADGWLDIYVCNAGNVDGDDLKNELYINNKDLTFTEQAEDYNLADNSLTTHAAFFDYDKDGDLDVYLLNNSFIPVNSLNYSNKRELRDRDWNVPDVLKGGGDKLLRNDQGKFVDVSEEAGIFGSLIGFGLGVTVGDVNNDNYPDIYISNDFYERDYLYINNKNGTFTESIKDWTNHISESSMGADMSDINNDGNPDIFVTDMLPENDKRLKETTAFQNYDLFNRKKGLDFYNQYMQNTLQLNLGNKTFADIAHFSGISKTDWSWGALLFDMNNDGYKDILVCNGIYRDLTNQDFINFFANDIIQKMVVEGKREEVQDIVAKMPSTPIPNYAFRNDGNLNFDNVTQEWGLDTPSFSNGAAYADLDNDGDLDLVINNVNQEVFVYQNNTSETQQNKYIKIKTVGNNQNTFGVGSVIELFGEGEIIRQEVIPSRGFQSSSDYIQTIGLGDKKIDSMTIIWPDNKRQTLKTVQMNSLLVLKQEDAIIKQLNNNADEKTLFTELTMPFEAHKENNYIDFDYEGLIQKMLSKEGPAIAVSDINNDGLEDVFVGGAKGQESKIYIQTKKGGFSHVSSESFIKDGYFEDTAASFFDADNDGDMDLMVGTGGNEVLDKQKYETRLYLNDGKGYFEKTEAGIPTTFNNTSVIAPYDFDNDGDIDVFIGSRSVPAVYGINATHQLLENDGHGHFKNITESKAYNFKGLGMVTDAEWFDYDDDGKDDLMIIGDWSAPVIFKNSGKRLAPVKTKLDSLKGWWYALKVADLNNDGRKDFILGNRGNNAPNKVKKNAPIKMYVNDFDDNGTIEQIFTQTINGKDVPIILKNELTNQLSSLKKQNLKYADYATRSIDELFPKEVLTRSIVREVNESNSVAVLSDGDDIIIKELPKEVQFSSVNAINIMDVNGDNNPDLVLGGNDYGYKPQYSRLDANYGSVLEGDGKGNFKWVNYNTSGFFVKGEIKNITPIKINNKNFIIVGINNQQPKFFELNNE